MKKNLHFLNLILALLAIQSCKSRKEVSSSCDKSKLTYCSPVRYEPLPIDIDCERIELDSKIVYQCTKPEDNGVVFDDFRVELQEGPPYESLELFADETTPLKNYHLLENVITVPKMAILNKESFSISFDSNE